MKIHPRHLIIGSIVLFLLNFLILANEMIFPGHELEGIFRLIAFGCVLIFAVGIIWAIFEPIFKRRESRPSITAITSSVMTSKKSQLALTTLEMVFNRLFAVLLTLPTIFYLLNILTIPTIIIFTAFIFYLWLGKKYHLFVNIIFLIFALGIYFIPISPIGWGLFHGLRELRLSGYKFNVGSIFFIAPLIFISLSARNVLGNIFVYFKTSTVSRNIYFFITMVIVLVVILVYPLLV
ncbi:MAG: hypothetical protein WC508_00840 [Patescibacteria group bacterium]